MKKYLFVAVWLVCCFGLSAAEIVKLSHEPEEHEVIRENGVLTLANPRQLVSLIPEGGFQSGKIYEFTLLYRNEHRETRFEFLTGREREDGQNEHIRFFLTSDQMRRPEAFEFLIFHAAGGRSERRTFYLNYQPATGRNHLAASFSDLDQGLRKMESEANRMRRTLERDMPLRFGVAILNNQALFSINGTWLQSIPIADDFSLTIQGGTAFKDTVSVLDWNPAFLPLDISEQLNSSEIGGSRVNSLPTGEEITVHNIPFRISERGEFNNIDLSRSLIPFLHGDIRQTAAQLRWPWAGDNIPLRTILNIPFDNYEALYVLAATDAREDLIPRFTAQIFRLQAGHPKNFPSGEVPLFHAEASADTAYPVKTADGKSGNLHLVRVELDPGLLQEFSSDDIIGLELTKDVDVYKNYPDPNWVSMHGLGMPSAVRIFGVTLKYSPVKATFDPDAIANVWMEGNEVSYTVTLENITSSRRRASLTFEAVSYDGTETHRETRNVRVGPGETEELNFRFMPARFGHHDISLTKEDESGMQTFRRTMSYLRERDHSPRSFDTRGTMYATFDDQHYKPPYLYRRKVAGMAGFNACSNPHAANRCPDARKIMKEYGQKVYEAGHVGRFMRALSGIDNIADNMDEAVERLVEYFAENIRTESDDIFDPSYFSLFMEPRRFLGSDLPPEFYNESPFDVKKLPEDETQRFERHKAALLAAVKAFRQVHPDSNIKILIPHGDPMFTIPFLQDPETRHVFDGAGLDAGYFLRMPEQQISTCSLHRYWMFHRVWERYRDDKPFQVYTEGPCISYPRVGGQNEEDYAAHTVRAALIVSGYDCHLQFSVSQVFSPGSAWGEQQYARGLISRKNGMNPFVAYSAFATHIRHTRDVRFESYTFPGSHSVYCSNFRHKNTGEQVRIIWNMRGTREVILDAAPESIRVYDAMDNIVDPENRDGRSVLTVGKLPVYVYGTDADMAVGVGAFDHSDSRLGEFHVKLGNAADIFTIQSDDADPEYMDNAPRDQMRRFHAEMDIGTVDAESMYGGRTLSVFLPEQEIDRLVMPYYTCLKPETPIKIEGKGSHLSMWVNANSDWGRVVYVLRDANDTLWFSVGQTGSWNGDDMPGDSFFCFDGWRLVRYELPARTAWDNVRDHGHTRWGSSDRDAVMEHPLALEKIFIERRQKVMYGNDLVEIEDTKPVLLGDLYVEYEKAEDMSAEAVRILNTRMPKLAAEDLPDVIGELRMAGTLAPGRILSVNHPDENYDGTRGIFGFEAPEGAVSFDIYISRYPDGRGALLLGENLDASGALVSGFLAGEDFHAFLVYRNEDGETSLPSEGFKFMLEDLFGEQ